MADAYIDGVVALLHCNGDEGALTLNDAATGALWTTIPARYETNESPMVNRILSSELSTLEARFGGSSIHKLANVGYFETPSTRDLNLECYDFTVELWARTTHLANFSFLLAKYKEGSGGLSIGFMGDGSLYVTVTGSSNACPTPAGVIIENVWHHVALTRVTGKMRMFVDGVLLRDWDDMGYMSNNSPLTIGGYGSLETFRGNIDEVRITKGQCRYYANFTPPTEPFDDPLILRTLAATTTRHISSDTFRKTSSVPEYAAGKICIKLQHSVPGRMKSGVPQYLEHGLAKAPINRAGFGFTMDRYCVVDATPMPQRFIGLTLGRKDVVNGGGGKINGILLERGAPCKPIYREVKLLDEVTGSVIAAAWSNPETGEYAFVNLIQTRLYTVLAYDHKGVYRTVVANGIRPTRI